MKLKLITIIAILVFACANAEGQYVNLPDSNFRNSIRQQWPGAFNISGQLDTSNLQIITTYQLAVNNAGIKDLTGVKYFKGITSLLSNGNLLNNFPELPPLLDSIYCDDNQFSFVPNLQPNLSLLSINSNQIVSVNSLPNTLKYLLINNNPVTNIDSLPNQLISFSCNNTSIKTLPLLPNTLQQLFCSTSKLTSLPPLPASLTELNCSEDSLVSLPALPASLVYLYCEKNYLQTLPILPAQLVVLKCDENKLTSLPALPPKLKVLSCSYNQLSNISVLSDSISTFSCNNNILTALPALPDKLVSLNCSNNLLDSLPELPPLLTTINCNSNKIGILRLLPSFLEYLACSQNRLSTLPVLPGGLKYLYSENNLFSTLPALPASLRGLYSRGNQIAALSTLPDSLATLDIAFNQITSLPKLSDSLINLNVSGNANLNCLPFLPKLLSTVNYSGTGIKCVPNKPGGCQFEPSNTEVCVATNNVNQCISFPQIYGFLFNDNNSNGIYDNGDVPRKNLRVKLNNGYYSYSDNNGNYIITADTIGTYRTDVEAPAFYIPLPFSNIHLFTGYTDVAYDTFALQPYIIEDSLSIHILPAQQKAKPGQVFTYHVKGENVGTTTLNTLMSLRFDTSRLVYDSSSVIDVILSGDSLTLSTNNCIPGKDISFIGYFHVKQNAVIGDFIKAESRLRSNLTSNIDSAKTAVSGNFPPNSKQGTPVITTAQLSLGGFIEYTIYFQNTGTDTVINVVITDTLSPKLRTSLVGILATSHICKTTLGSNFILFEFKNINLPDSGTNFPKSIGFIKFRIRPDSTLMPGDSISNKANIYFDFSGPIVTNTCQTLIKATVLPLQLIQYNIKKHNDTIIINDWLTAYDKNILYYNIQKSIRGKDFITIGRVNSKAQGYINSYQFKDAIQANITSGEILYRLEIVDADGNKTYSPVQKINWSRRKNIVIYPNPANREVSVTGTKLYSVSLFDINGKALLYRNVLSENYCRINIEKLVKGIYILQIIQDNGNITNEFLNVQ